jgi:hypothetical protein
MTISAETLKQYIESIYPPGLKKWIVPYSYTVTFTALAAAGNAIQTLTMQANADFVHTRIGFKANVAAAAQTSSTIVVPQVRLLITDTGTNEQYSNAQVDLSTLATAGIGMPTITELPYPRFVAGRSSLLLNMTSYEAANTLNVDVVLTGVLVRAYN